MFADNVWADARQVQETYACLGKEKMVQSLSQHQEEVHLGLKQIAVDCQKLWAVVGHYSAIVELFQ